MEDDVGLFCFVFIVAQDSLEKVICLIPMSVTTELLLQKDQRTRSATRDWRVDQTSPGEGRTRGKLNPPCPDTREGGRQVKLENGVWEGSRELPL